MRRIVGFILVVLALAGAVAPSMAGATDVCAPRMLVLSAFPGEIDKILTDPGTHITDSVPLNGRTFYVGEVRGVHAVMGLTGIGLVNAETTSRAALAHFRCAGATSISGIVFSGVAGGPHIGDVTIPARWTLDGTTRFDVDADMLATASAVRSNVHLARSTPVGDLPCAGTDPDLIETVPVDVAPDVIVGGVGESSDGFGGRALPCIPGGGDVFGCAPCRAPSHEVPDLQRFATDAVPFVDPNFFFGYFQSSPPPGNYVAQDMETAAVAKVASEAGLAFIAFRAASDGGGDPLHLPGFPFQFFFYRQLAADNAAAVALAFLGQWALR